MRARLVEDRIGHSPAGHERRLPAGTVVDITGINPAGHMRAHYHGYQLSVGQDQATPIDEEVSSMRIVIVEAGTGCTERVGAFEAELAGAVDEMIEQAKAAVAACGYRVMPDTEGGCCEYQAVSGGEDYIGISVYPGKR